MFNCKPFLRNKYLIINGKVKEKQWCSLEVWTTKWGVIKMAACQSLEVISDSEFQSTKKYLLHEGREFKIKHRIINCITKKYLNTWVLAGWWLGGTYVMCMGWLGAGGWNKADSGGSGSGCRLNVLWTTPKAESDGCCSRFVTCWFWYL